MKNKMIRNKKSTRALTSVFNTKICLRSKHSPHASTHNNWNQFVSCKRSQEEIVGFALIIIIVAVILLIFLGFYLRAPQKEIIESYEIESFIQSFLQYTSDCETNLEFLPVKNLIFACYENQRCLGEKDSCDVLNSTLDGILKQSWKIEGDRPVKGYNLKITAGNNSIYSIAQGNMTDNYKGGFQDFSRSGNLFEISFTAYY